MKEKKALITWAFSMEWILLPNALHVFASIGTILFYTNSEITMERFLISYNAFDVCVIFRSKLIHSISFHTWSFYRFKRTVGLTTLVFYSCFCYPFPCFFLLQFISIRRLHSHSYASVSLHVSLDSHYKCWHFVQSIGSLHFFSPLVIKTNWHIQSILFYLMHDWFSVN